MEQNNEEFLSKVRQYSTIKKQVEEIQSREKALKKDLKEYVEVFGYQDDKGSYVLDVDDSVSGVRKMINQRRVSKSFDPDRAETLLTEKNLLDRCTTMVPILDEQEILAVRYEELLTDDDIDSMFPAKESFAFIFVQD